MSRDPNGGKHQSGFWLENLPVYLHMIPDLRYTSFNNKHNAHIPGNLVGYMVR